MLSVLPSMVTAHAGFNAPGGPSDLSQDNKLTSIIHAVNFGPDAVEADVSPAIINGQQTLMVTHNLGEDLLLHPTLEELLCLFSGSHPLSSCLNKNGNTVRIQLDAKADGLIPDILDLLKKLNFPLSRIILAGDSSYSHVESQLDRIRKAVDDGMEFWMNPNFILSYEAMAQDFPAFLDRIRHLHLPDFTVNSDYHALTDDLLRRFQEEGIRVSAWTLNNFEEARVQFFRGFYNVTTRLLPVLELRNQKS